MARNQPGKMLLCCLMRDGEGKRRRGSSHREEQREPRLTRMTGAGRRRWPRKEAKPKPQPSVRNARVTVARSRLSGARTRRPSRLRRGGWLAGATGRGAVGGGEYCCWGRLGTGGATSRAACCCTCTCICSEGAAQNRASAQFLNACAPGSHPSNRSTAGVAAAPAFPIQSKQCC